MTNETAPKRIWATYNDAFGINWQDGQFTTSEQPACGRYTPYVRADISEIRTERVRSELEAAQARIAELEGQNQRLIEDRARFPDRPDWVGDVIGAHFKNMEHRIESAERYTRQYEARLRMEQRKTKELIEALKNIVTWGNSDHCTKLRSIARAALEGKGCPTNQDSHGTDQQHESQECQSD